MIANYHTHTFRCNHAQGSEEQYIQRAIEAGIEILGFSDHSPQFYPGGYTSRIRMLPEQLEDYAMTLYVLRQQYSGQIRLHIGLEAEYYPGLFPELREIIRDYPIEYLIMGQHWCGNEVNEAYVGRPTEDVDFLKRYYRQVLDGLDTGLFTYVAHPDVLHFVGDEKVYEEQTRMFCREVADRRIPLEINLLGLRNRSHYPNPAFWRVAGQENCQVVLGVDAHHPDHFQLTEVEAEALAFAAQFGITPVREVTIRSVR
jgi:histidinol-phosphatase (PHP family)